MSNFIEIKKCRICGSAEFEPVMSLGNQFMTGTFPKNLDENITGGPVDLIRCSSRSGCGLVQLKQSYNLEEMYGLNYGYRSGLNQSMVSHLHNKIDKILEMDILIDNDFVIDIGSNDATSLKRYPSGKYNLVGIDPTGIKFSSYYTSGIKLVSEFFSAEAVNKATNGKKAKIITAFSMFYDLEDPITFAKEIAGSLDRNGIWVFEQSYMPLMLERNSFDTICHEHLDFYSLTQIKWILDETELKIIDVEFNNVNGGSFSVVAALKDSEIIPNHEAINQILKNEKNLKLDTASPYDEFKKRVDREQKRFMDFLIEAKQSGKRVCGLGASTKGNVLLQYYGINSELISEIGEVNEDKYGSYTPGTMIPLVNEDKILESNPDYLVVLPWHFKDFFIQIEKFKNKGFKLVFPLPEFHIVDV
jgi:hypothetical protein